jgi:hypothetical protein
MNHTLWPQSICGLRLTRLRNKLIARKLVQRGAIEGDIVQEENDTPSPPDNLPQPSDTACLIFPFRS